MITVRMVCWYTIYSASAFAPNSILRLLFGFAFRCSQSPMFHRLGVHSASMILTVPALACVLLPYTLFQIRLCHTKEMQVGNRSGKGQENGLGEAATKRASTGDQLYFAPHSAIQQ
jgi:hypothetical protein